MAVNTAAIGATTASEEPAESADGPVRVDVDARPGVRALERPAAALLERIRDRGSGRNSLRFAMVAMPDSTSSVC